MHRSFWLEQALASSADDPNPLRGAVTCDIAIVGGGFVGLWTALMIKLGDRGWTSASIIRKEDAEALDKRPPRLAVTLSKLAPTDLEDK